MATGSEISEVICAAESSTLWPAVSQYSRAAEVAVLVSQYSVMSSNTSSLCSRRAGSPLL